MRVRFRKHFGDDNRLFSTTTEPRSCRRSHHGSSSGGFSDLRVNVLATIRYDIYGAVFQEICFISRFFFFFFFSSSTLVFQERLWKAYLFLVHIIEFLFFVETGL